MKKILNIQTKIKELSTAIEKARTNLKTKLNSKGISLGGSESLRQLIALIPAVVSPPTNLSSRTYGHSGVMIGEGFLFSGGYSSSFSNPFRTQHYYKNSTNTFTQKADLRTATGRIEGVVVNNSNVLISGGYVSSGINKQQLYNFASNSSTTKANLPKSNFDYSVANINNNSLISGGSYFNSQQSLYNTTTDTYSSRADLPTERTDHYGTLINNNRVVIGGGYPSPTNTQSQIIYTYNSDTFTTATNIPATVLQGAGVTIDNNVLIVGGIDNPGPMYLYNTSYNSYSKHLDLGSRMNYHTAILDKFRNVLISGGTINNNPTAEQRLYVFDEKRFIT